MSRVFTKVSLFKDGKDHPLSLPLVLPSRYTFDVKTQQLTEDELSSRSNDFKLVPETVELLESITKPVAVVSINGPFRSGKSYFLSRLLGNKETFKLGHTTDACTRGIWMATSVLECEEFVLVLLDTEGIDATGKADETGATRLLVLTMLLSSMFIYNSRNVPYGRDLKRMSYLTGLSRMMDDDTSNCVLPSFLWLLRDVDSTPGAANGKPQSHTEFLHQILRKTKSCAASSTLLQYFPSLNCLAIPPPSTDSATLADITSNAEHLTRYFNEGLRAAIDYVLDNVKIKQSYDSSIACNGSILACLVQQHFSKVSETSDEIPTFKLSWVMAIELQLKKILNRLVGEYECEMKALLEKRLPIENGFQGETGETLMNIHLQVFAKKRLEFQKALSSFCSNSLSEALSTFEVTAIKDFDTSIVELDSQHQVIGGCLNQFVQSNAIASEVACTTLYNQKYEELVFPKIQNALSTRIPTCIDHELVTLEAEYFKEAVGPAVHDAYGKLRAESSKLEAELSLIPGCVHNLKILGVGRDRVKLQWKCPKVNPHAVEFYQLLMKSKRKEPELVSTCYDLSALLTGLACGTWYCIAVVPANQKYSSGVSMCVKFKTNLSHTAEGVLATAASLASPVTLPCMMVAAHQPVDKKNTFGMVMSTLMCLQLIPMYAAIGLLPGVGNGLSAGIAVYFSRDSRKDLSEDNAERIHWEGKPLKRLEDIELPSDSEETELSLEESANN